MAVQVSNGQKFIFTVIGTLSFEQMLAYSYQHTAKIKQVSNLATYPSQF
jgi:hypothetical protein